MAGNQSANYILKQLIGLTWHKKANQLEKEFEEAARMSPSEETLSWVTPASETPRKNHMSSFVTCLERHMRVEETTVTGSGVWLVSDSNLKTAKCTENLIKKGFSARKSCLASLTWPLSIFRILTFPISFPLWLTACKHFPPQKKIIFLRTLLSFLVFLPTHKKIQFIVCVSVCVCAEGWCGRGKLPKTDNAIN